MSTIGDDDSQPILVPRSERALVTTSAERVRRLRRHLIAALRASRGSEAPPVPPSPRRHDAFIDRVTRAACSLCRGWCCRGGGDHAFLDQQTMARVRTGRPDLNARGILQLYLGSAPKTGYAGSCLFHGNEGCTLPPSLRSDVCNAYFCGGLDAFLTSDDTAAPVVIIAGEGSRMRTSPVLQP